MLEFIAASIALVVTIFSALLCFIISAFGALMSMPSWIICTLVIVFIAVLLCQEVKKKVNEK